VNDARGRAEQAATWLKRLLEARPRHVALGALAAGLALSAAPRAAVPAAAALALALGAAARAGALGALAAVALAAGALAGHARIEAIDRPGERLSSGSQVEGLAHLLEEPRQGRFGRSAELRMASGTARGARLLGRFRVGARLPRGAGPGAEVRLNGWLRPPPRPREGFDVAAFRRREGIAGELAVADVTPTGRRRGGLSGVLDRARRGAEASASKDLPRPLGALVRGMVLGQDEAIEPSVRQDFRDSGLAHLLAVSGQNVMLLAALAMPLLAAAGLPPRTRMAIAAGLIAAYVPLAGAGPSLQRAGVMGIASLAALGAARPASRAYALLLAACVTLALNPRACGDPGWQLSFAAVAGILVLVPPLRRMLAGLPRLLAEGVAVTVAATLATAPLIAHHFGSLPLAGLAANIAALPLVAPLMWLGMVRAGLGALGLTQGFGPAEAANRLIGTCLEPLLAALASLATTFAAMRGGQVALPLGSRGALTLGYLLLAAALLGAGRLGRRFDPGPLAARWRRRSRAERAAVAAAAGLAAAVGLAALLGPRAPPDRLTVSFLDVGQGDATLVQHPDGTAVLFDGGPPEAGVARLLRRAGVKRLSVLVMTHASRDHHGGLREVVERMPVDLLLDGGDGTRDPAFRATVSAALRRGARRLVATAPRELRAGALAIRLLAPRSRPPGPPPEDPNERAVVATVRSEGFDLLLSADAESPSLVPLALPQVDAMKVPHHGSADPGLPELLARLRPSVAVIEVGENSYGHPAPSTLAALRNARVRTFRTDRDKTVRLAVKDGRMSVEAGG
jgi:competence protein ComEC